jgi:heparan sulfate 2-O-sulfotransferase HS2ST1
VDKYFLVGLTEDLESFVDVLESSLPRFFSGAGAMFRSSDKLSHIRKTKHKDPVPILQSRKVQFLFRNYGQNVIQKL